MTLLSVSIICKNEEQKILNCLQAADQVADEIILVDSGSTDRTLEIARQFKRIKIYQQDWLGYGKQKNFAMEKCLGVWVLSLDADEVLSTELIKEILELKAHELQTSNSPRKAGYRIARKLFIADKAILNGGYYPDYQLRLVNKSLARFSSCEVHESIELKDELSGEYTKNFKAQVRDLKNPLLHYSYNNYAEMEQAYLKFAKLSPAKPAPKWLRSLKVFHTFFYKYFVRLGFLDGSLGFRLALLNARYTHLKYGKRFK